MNSNGISSGNNRYIYLLKNIGFLTLGNFSTKLLTFFLVPLYTSILSTADYGTYDLVSTTITLLVPILTLNIADGTLRFAIENNTSKTSVFTISIRHFFLGAIEVAVFVGLNNYFGFISSLQGLGFFVIVQFLLSALNGILSSFARGIGKVKEMSIAGVLGSLISVLLNILFLAVLGYGLQGYFWANIIGVATQCFCLFVSTQAWKYISIKRAKDVELQKKMHRYSFPLIANNLAWWINNASDRYIVTWICGVSANGIYSVAYKIPSIISIVQSIFQQAWTLSAIKDFNSSDKDEYFSKVYRYVSFVLVGCCSGLIMLDKVLAGFLYAKDFYTAWKYVPFLLLATVFSGMGNYIGGIFQAASDSKAIMNSTVISAILNIILNIILIFQIGPMGAAISTLIANVVNWTIRMHLSRKYVTLNVRLVRDIMAYILLLVQSFFLFISINESLFFIAEITSLFIICVLYMREIKDLFQLIFKIRKKVI